MTKLRWGLLSTARINRSVIPPIRASDRGELAAVASRNAAKGEAYAKEWNIPKTFGSYEAMLESDEVDIVYNSLPNGLHAEWSIKAMEAGKHVLLEKPFTVSVAEADAVIETAKRTGKVIAEAFMYRHHPLTFKLKELIDSGAVGTVKLVKSTFTFSIDDETDVRLDPNLGGGSLWDVGCYPMSFAQYVFGQPATEVFAYQWTDPSGTDGTLVGQLRYGRGQIAQIEGGFRTPYRTEAEIIGDKGTLTLTRPFRPDMGDGALISLYNGETHVNVPVDDQPMLYSGEVEDMHDAILNGTPSRVTLAESRGHIATICALYESAASGKPVQIS
jgi:D-xylose 1-dehydrogenase (NADP+, D-xylono-1,5-lactone-forming)